MLGSPPLLFSRKVKDMKILLERLCPLLIVLCLGFTLAQEPLTPSPQTVGWFGGSLGYPTSLHIGGYNLLAEDVHLRADLSLYAPFDLFLEGSVNALYDAGDGMYVGGGPHLSAGLCTICVLAGAALRGTYLGVNALAGYESGDGSMRFFVEGGAIAGIKLAGDPNAPSFRLRPRLALGLNFPF